MPTQENREAALQELTDNIKKMLETLSTPDEDIVATGSDGNHGRKRHNTYTCEYIAAYALAQMIDPVGPLERTYAYVNTTQGVVKRIEALLKETNEKLKEIIDRLPVMRVPMETASAEEAPAEE